jgi:hypothetical protein
MYIKNTQQTHAALVSGKGGMHIKPSITPENYVAVLVNDEY